MRSHVLGYAADGGLFVVGWEANGDVALAHARRNGLVTKRLLVAPKPSEPPMLQVPVRVGEAEGMATTPLPPALARHPLLNAADDRAVLVQREDGAAVAVTIVRATGDTVAVVRLPYRRQRVSAAAVEQWTTQFHKTASRARSAPARLNPDDLARALGKHAWLAPVSDVLVAVDGAVWLRREDDPGQTSVVYWVLDGQGRLLHTYLSPRTDRIAHVVGGRAWAIRTAADGTTSVVWYRVPSAGR